MIRETKKDEKPYKSSKDSTFHFSPSVTSIKDDRFHDSSASVFTEWWYFDSVFDNGYSAQMSLRFLSIVKNRFAIISQRLDIYKDGVLIRHARKKYYSLRKFEASSQYPLVKLDKNQVIKGEIDKDGKWVYHITSKVKDVSADLVFEGCTEGWKGTNPGGDSWVVILPRANVKGVLKITDEEIKVQGIGYHDHNWDVRRAAAGNHGWFWGKINFDTLTANWAVIFKNRTLGQPILVVNEINGTYVNIGPKNIDFVGSSLSRNNGRYIPRHFDLNVNAENIILDVSMDVKHVHHVRRMVKAHYWRFHLCCKGSITAFGKTQKINGTQIAEFLIF